MAQVMVPLSIEDLANAVRSLSPENREKLRGLLESDEALTPEEEADIEEARREISEGEFVTLEQFRAEFLPC